MRSELRSVALPTEHGGWSLTLEPVVLGLLVAWSVAGVALAAAALVAFLARAPLKLVLVDRWRGRRLDRTILAQRVAAVELTTLLALVVTAVVTAQHAFWAPVALAAPLILLELWHDMRSRSRRLIPELAGSIGIGSMATAIALAGGAAGGDAIGLWVVIGARAGAAVLFVRAQLLRSKRQEHVRWHSDGGQLLAVAIVISAWWGGIVPAAAVAVIAALAVFELTAVRRPPPRVAVLGAQQVVLGLTVVLVTGLGVRAPEILAATCRLSR